MALFVGMGMVFFDGGEAGAADAWAQGNAQWLKDNTQVLAAQASLVAQGQPGERTSYFGAFKVLPDGKLELVSAWHLDANGQVQQGMPSATPG